MARRAEELSIDQVSWIAVDAQGLGDPKPATPTARHLLKKFERLMRHQMDR